MTLPVLCSIVTGKPWIAAVVAAGLGIVVVGASGGGAVATRAESVVSVLSPHAPVTITIASARTSLRIKKHPPDSEDEESLRSKATNCPSSEDWFAPAGRRPGSLLPNAGFTVAGQRRFRTGLR